jgi:hypothetical protein
LLFWCTQNGGRMFHREEAHRTLGRFKEMRRHVKCCLWTESSSRRWIRLDQTLKLYKHLSTLVLNMSQSYTRTATLNHCSASSSRENRNRFQEEPLLMHQI